MAKRLLRLMVGATWVLSSMGVVRGDSTPQLIKVQGYLSDNSGGSSAPANGTFSMTFDLYDADLGGMLLKSVGPMSVGIAAGLYGIELPFLATDFTGPDRYLEITVDGETLVPRVRVASTPFAFMADKLDGMEGAALEESSEIAIVQGELQTQIDTLTSTAGNLQAQVDTLTSTAGNTLDAAYDEGGPGAGRTIDADAGPVHIAGVSGMVVDGALSAGDLVTTGPWVDIRAYGARGDGGTNDTAAIQAALDSLTSGGVVLIPVGTFKYTSPLGLRDNVVLKGMGWGSFLQYVPAAATSVGSIRNPSGSVIHTGMEDLRIQGHPNLSGPIVDLFRISNSAFVNVRIDGGGATGDAFSLNAGFESNYYNVFLHCYVDDSTSRALRYGWLFDRGANSNVVMASRTNFLSDPVRILDDATNQNMIAYNQFEWSGAGTAVFIEGVANAVLGNRVEADGGSVGIDFRQGSTDNNEAFNYITGTGVTDVVDAGIRNGRFGGDVSQARVLYMKNHIAFAPNGTAKLFFTNDYDLRTDGNFRVDGAITLGSNGTPVSKHISATATWDPGAMPDGTAESQTVSVSGAAMGDTVSVGFSSSVPGGALLAGAVTAGDMVTVTLFNKTGATIDLASGTLRADVWQH